MKSKIGILGGSFNPIHIGHILMCQYAFEQLDLEKVYLMPNEKPPHKDESFMINADERLQMCRIIEKKNDFIETISTEIGNNKTNYTVKTMEKLLKGKFKDHMIYFIIGADSLIQIETWKAYEKLFDLITLVCVMRPAFDQEEVLSKIKTLEDKFKIKIEQVEMPLIGLSSTDIRNRINNNKSVKYMLDSDVIDYIQSNSLFR